MSRFILVDDFHDDLQRILWRCVERQQKAGLYSHACAMYAIRRRNRLPMLRYRVRRDAMPEAPKGCVSVCLLASSGTPMYFGASGFKLTPRRARRCER